MTSPQAKEPVPRLPAWWSRFIQNVCEIPDRTSPDDEPEAMVATEPELVACALRAIEAEGRARVVAAEPGEEVRRLRELLKGLETWGENNCHGNYDCTIPHADIHAAIALCERLSQPLGVDGAPAEPKA